MSQDSSYGYIDASSLKDFLADMKGKNDIDNANYQTLSILNNVKIKHYENYSFKTG